MMQEKTCPVCSRVIQSFSMLEAFTNHILTHPGMSPWAAVNHYHDQPTTTRPWNQQGRHTTKSTHHELKRTTRLREKGETER